MDSSTPVHDVGAGRRSQPIGRVLRERRNYHGWTLAQVSARTGISRSTLSKIENDLISPSYNTILQLCSGLEIEVGDLLTPASEAKRDPIMGRRSVTRGHSGLRMRNADFDYEYLCTEIAHKRIIPMLVDVRASSLNEVGGLWRHVGEEFVYVLAGAITLYSEFYEPENLQAGEFAYFDSTMGHAFIATDREPAKLLVVCSSATPNLAQTLREVLKQRLIANDSPDAPPPKRKKPATGVTPATPIDVRTPRTP